jgi:hypothetical protein
MLEPDLIELFVRPLDRLQVRYLVSGSVAAMLYGEPRVTHDIDCIVFLRASDVARLPEAFAAPEFYLPPAGVILTEVARERKGHFNIIHPDSGLKADFYTANRDEFHAWAFRHVRRYSIGSGDIKLAPPEYVIVRKLEYFREGGSEKHLRDIRAILQVSSDKLNLADLNEWVQRQGVEKEWKRVLENK